MNRSARGKRPGFYDSAPLDQMMGMIMVLAEEVSVLADHVDSLERVAAAKGIDLAGGIDQLELDPAALQAREARRQGLLRRLFYLLEKEAAEAKSRESDSGYRGILDEIAKG